ncbi:hypothetical protein [Methanoregula sp. UBA64]|jgi:hypothetical protein|uniref:hypothetical protein n=1 Tax=Methanoregula sp. UBA64 TaxID=1915554 RepID=UPI0025D13B2B|nr:hypothetical protein [Methanoregula sp. UBA64]
MTITTDFTTVNLAGQEAINEAGTGRNRAILHWQVIDRLSRLGGDADGLDGLDTTCGIESPGHISVPASAPDPVDADTLAQYV